MYSSIYRVQSSTRRLPIQALFGFTLKLVESYLFLSPQSLCVVVCPWYQPWVASYLRCCFSIVELSVLSPGTLLSHQPMLKRSQYQPHSHHSAGQKFSSLLIHTLPKGVHYTPTGSLIPEPQRKTTTHHHCHLVLVVGLFSTTSLT